MARKKVIKQHTLTENGSTLPKRERTKRAATTKNHTAFNKQKRDLHQLHKRAKAGLVKLEELTPEQRRLLTKYYGW